MLSDLLGLNWQVFESLNQGAGSDAPLDAFMRFSAQDLIFLVPLLFLALWIGLMRWPLRGTRISPSALGAQDTALEDRTRLLGQQMVLLTVVAAGFALAVNLVIAHLIAEPRPFVSHPGQVHLLIAHSADQSFPSDHETIAAALASMLLLYAGQLLAPVRGLAGRSIRPPRWLLLLAVPLAVLGALMALAIGVARIYTGVHYPLDILGGIACGLLGALLALALGRVVQPLLTGVVGLAERVHLA